MEYQYIAISDHPDDVISLSVGDQAETYALAHYKGLLRRGLNPSTSGVQLNKTPTTSSKNSPTNEVIDECNPDNGKGCPSSSQTSHDEYNPHSGKGCDRSSGTAHEDTSDETDRGKTNNTGTLHTDGKLLMKKHMLMPKRCRSREAIQRRRQQYKLRKRNRQKEPLKLP